MRRVSWYLWQVAYVLDFLLNVFPFFGSAGEFLSSRCHREQHKPFWGWMRRQVNRLFWWQEDHCKTSYQNQLRRKYMPAEYQQ